MQNLSDPGVIKEILYRHGFTFSKKLGQNFLINPSVCPRIAELGNARQGFGILEIGPGIGVLTNELCLKAEKVVAIELDSRLLPILSETLSEHKNLKIINADVMELNLIKIIEEEFQGLEVAVCANLPYYITSPVIMKLISERLPIVSVTMTVQREAANRLCAPVGTREAGAVTVAVDFYSEPKKLFNVSRSSFMPSPAVDSTVIQLKIRDKTPDVLDEKQFFRMVKSLFSQRRKTVLNALSIGVGLNRQEALSALESAGISPEIRPECLKMNELISLSHVLFKEKIT